MALKLLLNAAQTIFPQKYTNYFISDIFNQTGSTTDSININHHYF